MTGFKPTEFILLGGRPAMGKTLLALQIAMNQAMADILGQARGAGAQVMGQYTPEMRNQLYAAMLERPAPSVPDVAFAVMADEGRAHVRAVFLRLALVPLDDGRAGCVLAHGYLHG